MKLSTLSGLDISNSHSWDKLNQRTKKELFSLFSSKGLVKEYVAMAYGELELSTALKLLK